MLRLKKLFAMPGPKDLGKSDSNYALPLREFGAKDDDYCWEDYYKEVKKKFPIKYFFSKELPDFVRFNIWFPIKKPLEIIRYWLVSHFIISRRYHMLDLRQPKGYRYGWRDVPEKMLYAMFNLLGEYLKENPYDLTKDYSREQINADVGMKSQQDSLEEARALYQWWNVERILEEEINYKLLHIWHELYTSKKSKTKAYKARKILKKSEKEFEDKTDKMIARLMKIRRNLWT